jgi:hypothetical protein
LLYLAIAIENQTNFQSNRRIIRTESDSSDRMATTSGEYERAVESASSQLLR